MKPELCQCCRKAVTVDKVIDLRGGRKIYHFLCFYLMACADITEDDCL